MSKPIITFIYPIIRDDFIIKSIQTLQKFTDRSKYKLIVVDQSIGGVGGLGELGVDMIIRMKNQGFACASNTGIRVALSWGTPYIAVVNDDTEFIYPTWLEDALEEFKTDPRIIAINPECPKIAMWGYGMIGGEYLEILPYKENYTPEDINYLKAGDYNLTEIQSRHDYKIPLTFIHDHKEEDTIVHKRGVVDAFAGWLPIFKREGLIENGLYDERFVWGGGEDYDWMARAYSCAWPIEREVCDPQYHKRAVSTMKSWVWHHWGKSKDLLEELDPKLKEAREGWNHLDQLWTPNSDPWGHTDGKPNKRVKEIYTHIP